MKYCKQCGKEMADGTRQCPNCGAVSKEEVSKWSMGLIGCNIVGILLLFLGWVRISVLGVTKTISPMQFLGYLRDIDSYFGSYLNGYSDKIGMITMCGVCLIAAYAVSIVFVVMKKESAFLIGMIAHMVMISLSGEVAGAIIKVSKYTYQVVSVTGIVYIAFLFSIAAAALCIYVFAFHPELAESNYSNPEK